MAVFSRDQSGVVTLAGNLSILPPRRRDIEYRFKERELWALSNEQRWHEEALQNFGERIALRRVWTFEDFVEGRTTRCTSCHAGDSASVEARVAAVYQQSGDSRCLECYGTSYTGGYEPVVHITWMLADDGTREYQGPTTGGQMAYERSQPRVQFSWEPQVDPGDLVVRVREWSPDGIPLVEEQRYQVTGNVTQQTIRTGPGRIDTDILVGQEAQIASLPRDNIAYEVPI